MSNEQTPQGQLLIYNDGGLNLHVRLDGQTVWLTQAQLAELYQTTKQNISLHIQNILDDKELPFEAVVKEYLTTAADGKLPESSTCKEYSHVRCADARHQQAEDHANTQYELYERQRQELDTSDFDEAAKRLTEQPKAQKSRRRKKKADEGDA